MPGAAIASINLSRPDGNVLLGGFIDYPKVGPLPDGPAIEIHGWVMGAGRPAVSVEARRNGEVVATGPVGRDRTDLIDAYSRLPWAGRAGFHLSVPHDEKAESHELVLRARFESGARPVLATLRVEYGGIATIHLPDDSNAERIYVGLGEPQAPFADDSPIGLAHAPAHGSEWPPDLGPDPRLVHPVPDVRSFGFLKNIVRNPNIIVGDYTCCSDPVDARNFEANVLYASKHIRDKLIIGKFCGIAQNVRFMMNAANHLLDRISTYPFATFPGAWSRVMPKPSEMAYRGDTVIGNDVWLGYDAFILPGVRIGDGAIVGARSVVGSDVPPYAVVAGNPARVVRERFPGEVVSELLAIQWWNWPVEKITRHLEAITGADIAALRAAE